MKVGWNRSPLKRNVGRLALNITMEANNPRRRMLRKIMPELPVTDVAAGVAYYRDVLGFSINYQQHDLGVMDRDAVRLLLIGRARGHKGIGSCYFYVRCRRSLC